MKQSIVILLFLLNYSIIAQEINQTAKGAKGKLMLLGKTNKKAFDTPDFDWFSKNYKEYLTNDRVIKQCKDSLRNYTIKAFYGTWCGDSRRELPRFYKVLDKVKFNKNNLEVIGVDKKPEAYKESPKGEEKGLNVHRVPTFIFYKNNIEIGRIVEYPKQDFERDILTIVSRKKYTPQYAIVSYLNTLMSKSTLEELKKKEKKLMSYCAEFTKGSRELNTFGYKLLRSQQIEKALFVFELNTKMYPYKVNVFDSLGEAYYVIKNYEEALKNYNKALELKPDSKEILAMIEKIKKEKKS